MPFPQLRTEVTSILQNSNKTPEVRLKEICETLRSSISYYDWVGFYFAEQASKTLHLKAFAGETTDHTVIPFGKGICGQVAENNANFVVPNVNVQDNYLACNMNVKAEIVIPLFKDGKNIGQIDIDSHRVDPFTKDDEQFLEWVNKKVSEIL